MLLTRKALEESLSDKSLFGRTASIRLCEEIVYVHLDAYYAREAAKQEIAKHAELSDEGLAGRLVDAGFTPTTLPALRLVPIAFVAWASESVSEQESQASVAAIYEMQLHENTAALARVQNWLDSRPSQELWELWSDFTKHELLRSSHAVRQAKGRQLLSQATKVAIASGGVFGFGSISKAENALLQAMRDIFFGTK